VVNDYDAIVLDLMLPGIDGLEVCRELRERARKTTAIIMLSARGELADKLGGFDTGADDYLVKPVALEELEARLHAVVRRQRGAGTHRILEVGDLRLDEDTLQVHRSGRPIELTRLDLALLAVLMRESPRVVPRPRLEKWLWGDEPPASDSLRAHVHRLRAAIDRPFDHPLLHTVHGVGYRLAADARR
jgi:DNA-binding response OmpR family regulator